MTDYSGDNVLMWILDLPKLKLKIFAIIYAHDEVTIETYKNASKIVYDPCGLELRLEGFRLSNNSTHLRSDSKQCPGSYNFDQ